MKLQEDDAFTRVCVSVHGGSQVTITHDAMDLAVHAPPSLEMDFTGQVPPGHGTSLVRDSH